jgi:hypothetical protein
MASEENQVPDSFKYYEDGKHRRYSLLFAVNGGAFAIAKVFAEKNAGAVRLLAVGPVGLIVSLKFTRETCHAENTPKSTPVMSETTRVNDWTDVEENLLVGEDQRIQFLRNSKDQSLFSLHAMS